MLRLNKYDDIFSGFDIRPYSERALSVDFLDEIKRASRDKGDGNIELTILIPERLRNEHEEVVIRERLAAHFKRHHGILLKEKLHVKRVGVAMIAMGIVCMLAATFALSENISRNFLLSFLVVLLEPAAWFMLWEGMDQVIFTSKNLNPELNFYHKMANAHERIYFKSY